MGTLQGRYVIAGGSGFLGTSLAAHLTAQGASVVVLTRKRDPGSRPWAQAVWDARSDGDWASVLDGAAGVINLVGRSVDCVKTPDHRDEILRSRVEATLALGRACRSLASPPPVWVQMSTAHIYGDPPAVRCEESSPLGLGLAPDVGRAWEAAFDAARLPAQRGVVLRTSFVVGRPNSGGEGALGKLRLVARLGLGGSVGSGGQGMSWIHEVDMNRVVERGLTDASMSGVYITSSPNPVSQREFMAALRPVAGGLGGLGVALPAMAWMVRVGAPVVLGTDPELALYGRYVVPARLVREGFEFRFPAIGEALRDLHR